MNGKKLNNVLNQEPEGVNFTVNPKPISILERMQISDVIAHYKKTGEIKKILSDKKAKTVSKGA